MSENYGANYYRRKLAVAFIAAVGEAERKFRKEEKSKEEHNDSSSD